jgi:hypothetical protein
LPSGFPGVKGSVMMSTNTSGTTGYRTLTMGDQYSVIQTDDRRIEERVHQSGIEYHCRQFVSGLQSGFRSLLFGRSQGSQGSNAETGYSHLLSGGEKSPSNSIELRGASAASNIMASSATGSEERRRDVISEPHSTLRAFGRVAITTGRTPPDVATSTLGRNAPSCDISGKWAGAMKGGGTVVTTARRHYE